MNKKTNYHEPHHRCYCYYFNFTIIVFFLISCSKYFCELESFSRNSGQQVICDFIGWTISTNRNFHRLISFTRELRRSYGNWRPIKYCNNFTDLFAVERKKNYTVNAVSWGFPILTSKNLRLLSDYFLVLHEHLFQTHKWQCFVYRRSSPEKLCLVRRLN